MCPMYKIIYVKLRANEVAYGVSVIQVSCIQPYFIDHLPSSSTIVDHRQYGQFLRSRRLHRQIGPKVTPAQSLSILNH